MKIAYNWLKQFITVDWKADDIAELLTNLGLEVEGVDRYESVKGGLRGIVVGHVLSCEKHPNADRLKLTKIDLGDDIIVQIVCGAPNIAEGQKVPVATIGTILYDSEGKPWEIKKGKIRGEESYGMVCSEVELGLGKDNSGIMVLEEDAVPGTPCSEYFTISSDYIFDIGLTPNRADAMSHFGVARDLKSALLQHNVSTTLITPSVSSFQVNNRTLKIDVEVEDYELCPRYCGITLSGIKVSESPDWLKHRLASIGITPKNNVVDITNYVLHELGQPLHAFDASSISGNKIVVKTVKGGTKFTTLDDVVHELHEDDLMICDVEKPLCIAGVFGGINSGITEKTTTIFLESAFFNPISIRRTSKRHNLNTDASFRFERGVDINTTEYAMLRAATLIQEIAGGEISSDIVDRYPKKVEDFQVFLSFEKVHKLVGQEIPEETINQILTALEIKINNVTETGIGLTIPSYRVDVRREVDVIEEILRVYGYNTIQGNDKLNISISKTSRFEDYKLQNTIANQLVSQGFYEMMTNSLVRPEYLKLSQAHSEEESVKMLNPLSNDLAQMRQSLLYSSLETVAHNLNRQQNDLKLFEFGKTYHAHGKNYEEKKHLSLVVTGNQNSESWEQPLRKSNFFYIKGIVMAILQRLNIAVVATERTEDDTLSEGITIRTRKATIATLGVVQRNILRHFDIQQEVFFADIHWDAVLKAMTTANLVSNDIPKFPEVRRDLSLLLDKEIRFKAIDTVVQKSNDKRIKAIRLFDVYEGKNLPEGKKSYAVSFILQDDHKTLTDKEIDKIMHKLQKSLEKHLGAALRD